MTAESSLSPEIVVLHCQQSVSEPENLPSVFKKSGRTGLKFRLVPCSSKIQLPHLLKLLETGADGVIVFACPEEECRFLEGSGRVQRRIEHAQELLEQVGVGAGRLALVRGREMNAGEALGRVDGFARAVSGLGPNPVKGVSAR
jgi:F420-non-reducing hydrogenase iron-sulfur subunit